MRGPAGGQRLALLSTLLASVLAPILAPAAQAVTPKPPLASTGGALRVSDTLVTLKGAVNPHGSEATCYFQYGATTAYGAQTPAAAVGSGTARVTVTQVLTGLQLGTTYHYRLVAVSAAGTVAGQDRAFTTKQLPLKFVLTRLPSATIFGSPFSVAGTLTGTGGADRQVVMQANPFPFLGTFTDIGTPVSTDAEGSFSFRLPSLGQTTQLRVRTLDAAPSYSRVLTIHVATLVTLHVRSTRQPGIVRLEGTTSPSISGAAVTFQWVRAGRGPSRVGGAVTRRGNARLSRFSAVVSIRHSGSYRAFVKVTNGKQVSGFSRTVFIRAAAVRKAHRGHPRGRLARALRVGR